MKITNEMNLPQPLVSAVESNHRRIPRRYSTTDLLKGVRETILKRRHNDEITEDVSDSIWLIFGKAVHSILEDAKETETQLKENKIIVPVGDGYELSGIFDLYDDSTGTVTDYKTASVNKVMFNEWSDYRQQVLIYCWLLQQLGFEAWNGEIVALLKDHSKSKVGTKAGYPEHPVHTVSWQFTNKDMAEIEKAIKAKFELLKEAEKTPDDDLPPCTDEERWARGEKWAVKKARNKKARKLFDDPEEAEKLCEKLNESEGGYVVEHRPPKYVKCEGYCSAKQFCNQYKETFNDRG